MSKISNSVSEQLENAAQEALEQMGIVDPFTELMNAGAEYEKEKEEKPKRKRRTKAEMQAIREEESETVDTSILKTDKESHIIAYDIQWDTDDQDIDLPTKIEIPTEIFSQDEDYDMDTISDYLSDTTGFCHKGFSITYTRNHKDTDEFCDWEIEKAHLYGKDKPNFDFRNDYEKGQTVYFIRYHASQKTKELKKVRLRTIYPRMLIGVVDKEYCECIGINERDLIFFNQRDALNVFNQLEGRAEDEYNETTGKKKRKRKKSEDEDDINEYIDSEEEDDEDEDS